MSLATPAQQPQQQQPVFNPQVLHPDKRSTIETNSRPSFTKATFTFDAKHGTAIHEESTRQTNEYRSSKAFTPDIPADGARPRMGFVPVSEPRIHESNLSSSAPHVLGKKGGKASLKAHQCDKCTKKFARACDLRQVNSSH
jgi:hypothetical protein